MSILLAVIGRVSVRFQWGRAGAAGSGAAIVIHRPACPQAAGSLSIMFYSVSRSIVDSRAGVSAIADMIGALSEVCAGLPDQRKGPRRDGDYTMADIGLAAFSIFFMGSPSFLGHQQALAEGHGRSNCETLFAMSAIPSDNYIRLMEVIASAVS
jgi:hypothetical protein